jgi:hypothetical protein
MQELEDGPSQGYVLALAAEYQSFGGALDIAETHQTLFS